MVRCDRTLSADEMARFFRLMRMALRADSGCACYRDGTLLHLKVVLRERFLKLKRRAAKPAG